MMHGRKNKESCALKLVDEIILYYDARSKKHQITFKTVFLKICGKVYNTLHDAYHIVCNRYAYHVTIQKVAVLLSLVLLHLTYLLTYSIQHSPSWEADGCQIVKKFPAFYGTRKFITAFTSARHLFLSWASSIQFIPSHPTSWKSILILSSHQRLSLPSVLFPSGFPTKTLYKRLLSPIRATCRVRLILLDLITRTILGEFLLRLSFLYFLHLSESNPELLEY